MYGGQVGIALAGKGYRQTIPLWLLIFASQLPDWTDAAVCGSGVSSPPVEMLSHSIPAVAVLAAVLALLYYAARKDGQGSVLLALIVVSHMLADYLTGGKKTWPGGPVIGLQLYHRPLIDFIVESVVIFAGWMIYRRSLPAERQRSNPVMLILTVALVLQAAASLSFALFPGVSKC